MQQLLLLLPLAIGPAAEPSAAPESASASSQSERFDLALYRSFGMDADALGSELRLRLPEVAVEPHAQAGDLSGRQAPYLYLETKARTDDVYAIAVIVSDGRAYYGEVAVDEGLRPERVVASTLANLIFSIEQGTVAPDREDATIPPIEETAPPPTPEPSQATDDTSTDTTEPSEPEPRVEIAIAPRLGYALAVGPPSFADIYLGFGGGLSLELRTRRGVHAFADFRALGRSAHDYRLTRLRAALGAGFAWRRDNFELITDLGFAIEPWIVSSGAGIESIARDKDGVASHPPLLSAFLRLSPGYRITFDKGAVRALRLGPRLDIAAGFVPYSDPKAGVAEILARDGRQLFRVGGAEVTTALELAVWFGT